jgi:hypothetical protein
MPAPKFNMLSLLTKNVLHGGDPTARGVGQPLTFYWCRDTREMFLTDSVGNFINIGSLFASVLDGSLPLALPASPVAGPKGEKGDTGATGATGAQGLRGEKGEKGEKGDFSIPTDSEIAQAMVELRSKQARIQAALYNEMLRLPSLHGNSRIHVKNALDRIKKELQ